VEMAAAVAAAPDTRSIVLGCGSHSLLEFWGSFP
jgi:hypothetical protein